VNPTYVTSTHSRNSESSHVTENNLLFLFSNAYNEVFVS
jgi:hypothetical protein